MRPFVIANSAILRGIVCLGMGFCMNTATNAAEGLANKLIPWLGIGFMLLGVLIICQSMQSSAVYENNLNRRYEISLLNLTALGLSTSLLVMIAVCIEEPLPGLVIVSIMADSFLIFIPIALLLVLSVWSFLLALFTMKYRLSILLSASMMALLMIIKIAPFGR